mmetsp:Transcript_2455/g.7231  ORF Transcript_2455/g.7231 Transcript_2455/m.7231 type:complete len:290 (-) Transcript_2455:65-934(-)
MCWCGQFVSREARNRSFRLDAMRPNFVSDVMTELMPVASDFSPDWNVDREQGVWEEDGLLDAILDSMPIKETSRFVELFAPETSAKFLAPRGPSKDILDWTHSREEDADELLNPHLCGEVPHISCLGPTRPDIAGGAGPRGWNRQRARSSQVQGKLPLARQNRASKRAHPGRVLPTISEEQEIPDMTYDWIAGLLEQAASRKNVFDDSGFPMQSRVVAQGDDFDEEDVDSSYKSDCSTKSSQESSERGASRSRRLSPDWLSVGFGFSLASRSLRTLTGSRLKSRVVVPL